MTTSLYGTWERASPVQGEGISEAYPAHATTLSSCTVQDRGPWNLLHQECQSKPSLASVGVFARGAADTQGLSAARFPRRAAIAAAFDTTQGSRHSDTARHILSDVLHKPNSMAGSCCKWWLPETDF